LLVLLQTRILNVPLLHLFVKFVPVVTDQLLGLCRQAAGHHCENNCGIPLRPDRS